MSQATSGSAAPCGDPLRARHPPARSTLVSVWLAAAVTLGAILTAAQVAATPGDDPDPAFQRPGLLDVADLPVVAPHISPDLPALGRRLVLFAVREDKVAELCNALPGPLDGLDDLDIAVVSDAPAIDGCPAEVTTVADAAGLVAAYGFRDPLGDVTPTGYVVVDSAGRTRYRTLDPEVDDLLDEVATIVRAAP